MVLDLNAILFIDSMIYIHLLIISEYSMIHFHLITFSISYSNTLQEYHHYNIHKPNKHYFKSKSFQ